MAIDTQFDVKTLQILRVVRSVRRMAGGAFHAVMGQKRLQPLVAMGLVIEMTPHAEGRLRRGQKRRGRRGVRIVAIHA